MYDRYAMQREAKCAGPAIVEERESTAVIGPGGICHIDEQSNLIVEFR